MKTYRSPRMQRLLEEKPGQARKLISRAIQEVKAGKKTKSVSIRSGVK